MKAFILAVALSACCAIQALAAHVHPPVPRAVTKAKTVFILNNTGIQQISDSAYDKIEQWGRFSVVQDKSSADLVIHFTSHERFVNGSSRPRVSMFVTNVASPDPLFQDTERGWTWKGVASSEIKSFQKWLEGTNHD